MQATLSGTTLRATLTRIVHSTGAWLAVALLMVIAPSLHAQVTATISGTVTDPKGAVVQGATVTIVDETTGSPRAAETNKDGVFATPNLIPSTYTVKVVAQGFAPKELTGIALHSGDEIRLPTFVLAIGATTDTVTVTSVAGQILETENGQRTETLTYQDVQDIALTGRDTTELLKVLPGVVQVNNNGLQVNTQTTGTSVIGNGMGINGTPYKGGAALNMDGADIIDIGDDFSALATVNPEMTQEVQVMSSNYGADVANGPVVINTTGKSGGEHYHGEGYFDVRNDVLNANDWSDNHTTPVHPKGGASFYYPGGSISGPVPHTNKKLFFFGGFEMPFVNQGNNNIIKSYIPTPEMLQGDFSMDNTDNQILCPGGFYGNGPGNSSTVGFTSPVGNNYGEGAWCQNIVQNGGNTQYTIYDDGTSPTPVSVNGSTTVTTTYGTTTVTNSTGGMVPVGKIDPNMVAFSKLWPAWNSPYVAKTTNAIIQNGGFNFYEPIINHDNGWIARGRLDFNWNSTNQFYISYQQGFDQQLASNCGSSFYGGCGSALQFPGGGLIKKTYSKVLNGHYVHTFSPTLTNEMMASWVWGNIPVLPGNSPQADWKSTVNATFGCVYCAGSKFMPLIGTSGGAFPGFGQADDWEPNNYYIVQKSVPTFSDNLTKVWGRHTVKVGGMESNTDNYQGNQSTNLNGNLSVGGAISSQNYNYFAKVAGTCGATCVSTAYPGGYGSQTGQYVGSNNPTANFITGTLSNYQESNSSPLSDVAFQTVAFYVDDSIKVSKQFSIDVGMRFEHIGWWYDREGVGLAVFYPSRVLPDFYAGKYAPGFYWHAIDGSLPLSGRPNRLLFADPRLGMSYDLFGNGKTLLRGGWGAYRYQEAANGPQNALNTAQGVQNFNVQSVLGTNQYDFTVSQLNQLQSLAPNCQVACPQNGQTGYSPDDYGLPLNYAYNFTIDQKIPWGMQLEVGYVGNRAIHMSDNGQDGASVGGFDNQNKTPLYAYGQLVGGVWQGNVDPITKLTICNPENLTNAPCSKGSVAADFQPYGKAIGCSNFGSTATQNPTCSVYGTAGVTMVQNNVYQNYNSLQAQLVKRSGPVTLNLNFTWSKSLGTTQTFDPFYMPANNWYDNLNRPFVFNSNYIYREPNFWHGNRFVGGAVNGWTISGITLWQKGTNTLPNINIVYDPTTIPAAGNIYGMTTSTLGVGQATFFGTNAGMATGRPQLTCDPKSGLVYHQLYRPCFTAAPFGSSGGLGLPFIAGQAFMENDLAIFKTFSIHEQNKVQFRLDAFNWLNHPLPQFAGSGESNTEYYYYNYSTHALYANSTSTGAAVGSANPSGAPYLATTTYSNGQNPADVFGQMHFKQGFVSQNSQRTLELEVKYNF